MSDNLKLALGIVFGALICVSLVVWQVSKDRAIQKKQEALQLHVACLNGGGVWKNNECHRPTLPTTEDQNDD